MSENTRILSLPLIQGGQAQKHITHNEALRRLDALVQPVVADLDLTTPPTQPNEGDRHIVGPGATGDWAGQDSKIAVREGQSWTFIAPAPGWRVHVLALGGDVLFDGTEWADTGAAMPSSLGINMAADDTNRLSVAADATLLTHDTTGSHQVKVNKAGAADTASLLFQSGYSGRAEMGCTGSDDFAVKVSADGAVWTTAMTVDAATGVATFPAGLVAPSLALGSHAIPFGGRWSVYADNRWITFSDVYGPNSDKHFETAGTDPEPLLKWSHTGLTVQEGATIQSLTGMIRTLSPQVGAIDIRGIVQTGMDGLPWNDDANTQFTTILSADNIALGDGWSEIDLPAAPFVLPRNGMFVLFLRPVGTLTSIQQLVGNFALDVSC